jgi:excisionase family DNA binding protein
MKPLVGEEPDRTTRSNRNGMETRLLTIDEVASLTNLSVGTLYHFVSQRRIPVVRLSKRCIRFRYSDLVEWIESLTQNGAEPCTRKESNNNLSSVAKQQYGRGR